MEQKAQSVEDEALLERAAEKVMTGKDRLLSDEERNALRQHLSGTLLKLHKPPERIQ